MTPGLSIQTLAFAMVLVTSLVPRPALAVHENDLVTNSWTSQSQFSATVRDYLKSHGKLSKFTTEDGVPIAYASVETDVPDAENLGDILVVLGKSETLLNYAETIYDLTREGYSVHIYDPRSQGLSGRIVKKNSRIIHVDNFEDYVNDLRAFAKKIFSIPARRGSKKFILAHSTGALVALHYLARYKPPIDHLTLLDPLARPKTRGFPTKVAHLIAKGHIAFGLDKSYVWGGKAHPIERIFPETSSRSPIRQAERNKTYRRFGMARSGDISWNWLDQVLTASDELERLAPEVEVPVTILQAEENGYVDPKAQLVLARILPDCELCKLDGAGHDMLFDRDLTRDPVMTRIKRSFADSSRVALHRIRALK